MTKYDALDIAVYALRHFANIGNDEAAEAGNIVSRMQEQLIRHAARRHLRHRAIRQAFAIKD